MRAGALGSTDDGPGRRERFLQSLVSAKGARRRPRERSSAGASGSLLPAGSGKADAVWSNTRQTATTSHNFILESRPAAAPARAGGVGERTTPCKLGSDAQDPGAARRPALNSTLLFPHSCRPALTRAPMVSRSDSRTPQAQPAFPTPATADRFSALHSPGPRFWT